MAATTALLCAVEWLIAGTALQSWTVGLGMDDERGALIAAVLLVAAGAAAVTLVSGRTIAVRAGAVLAFIGIEVAPFLVRGTRVITAPGLTAHLTVQGWVAQPIGMLLLAGAAISLGVAGGKMARRDLLALWRLLRTRMAARAALPVAGVMIYVAAGAVTVALQDGPVSALYSYSQPPQVSVRSTVAATSVTPSAAPGHGPAAAIAAPTSVNGAASTESEVATVVRDGPAPTSAGVGAGTVDTLSIGGRRVNVYRPAAYDASTDEAFPVLYLLHGYPGTCEQWLGPGAQLPGVLDQMIATAQMPALIAVQPDGNGQVLSDAEWGDDARGDQVESWLTTRVIPAIDRRYRTLGKPYRGIAGLSAGGFAAVNIALHHPELFRWAGSYSGYFWARADIFGSRAAANSPEHTVDGLAPAQRMPLFIAVGDTDRAYLGENARFVRHLGALGWAPFDSEVVAGGHGWEAWRAEMISSLRWLQSLWGRTPGRPSLSAPPGRSSPPLPASSVSGGHSAADAAPAWTPSRGASR